MLENTSLVDLPVTSAVVDGWRHVIGGRAKCKVWHLSIRSQFVAEVRMRPMIG